MKGFQITFFTQQDRKHKGIPLAEWLLKFAQEHGAKGGTLTAGAEGFGRDGHVHSSHFFELADQPQELTLAMDEATCTSLFQALESEGVSVFYVKTAVEYGAIGSP
ncbi:DUF190 domain-containing protein [Herbaspirillum camelliae]|uniref:DUF190 domain-containing protein n=1 Tax=Herbaspirillum camelliae TaxID=1892903 RepID=UPI000949CDAD|nr:DUF190 domain-containing protein [Herbaspirillum camelliae]